jgi:hypothetical protein
MFLGSKAWLVCKVDNLTAICEPHAMAVLYSAEALYFCFRYSFMLEDE